MKKLIAISLLTIHLFSIVGHLAMHQYFVYKSDKLFKEQAAKNRYNINDLTEVKIPVHMPGITDWPRYENVVGNIKFGNNSYNYVKMRVTQNALYLMCIPNYETTQHLSSDNLIAVNGIDDVPVPKKEHVPFGKIQMLDTFQFSFVQFAFNCTVISLKTFTIQPVQKACSQSLDIPEQPPKFSC